MKFYGIRSKRNRLIFSANISEICSGIVWDDTRGIYSFMKTEIKVGIIVAVIEAVLALAGG